MPFRTAPGTYTNTPLGKELSKTQKLQKESYPIARTTRATPVLDDFGPVNYERFTKEANSTIIIILVIVIVACIIYYVYKKHRTVSYKPEMTYIPEIEYPRIEGGAKVKKTHIKHCKDCPCGDDLDDIYQMKANGMMI